MPQRSKPTKAKARGPKSWRKAPKRSWAPEVDGFLKVQGWVCVLWMFFLEGPPVGPAGGLLVVADFLGLVI